MEIDIDEDIEVIVLFKKGIPRPVRFVWNNNIYPIKKINSYWISTIGTNRIIHYSVNTNTNTTFEIVLNTDFLKWKLLKSMIY